MKKISFLIALAAIMAMSATFVAASEPEPGDWFVCNPVACEDNVTWWHCFEEGSTECQQYACFGWGCSYSGSC